MKLDTKEAVRLAKEWAAAQLSDEGVTDIGLEEVKWYDGYWQITLGFSRRWDLGPSTINALVGGSRPRTYKVITISDEDGTVVSMRNREAA